MITASRTAWGGEGRGGGACENSRSSPPAPRFRTQTPGGEMDGRRPLPPCPLRGPLPRRARVLGPGGSAAEEGRACAAVRARGGGAAASPTALAGSPRGAPVSVAPRPAAHGAPGRRPSPPSSPAPARPPPPPPRSPLALSPDARSRRSGPGVRAARGGPGPSERAEAAGPGPAQRAVIGAAARAGRAGRGAGAPSPPCAPAGARPLSARPLGCQRPGGRRRTPRGGQRGPR